ncbi:MAG: hypothetical protein ACR2L7_00905 [Candidatus Actinomarina sp.]
MKKIPILSFTIFALFIVSVIVIFNINNDPFGQNFVDQIKIADSDNTLTQLSNEELISLGKSICNSSDEWDDEASSLEVIERVVLDSGVIISENDRIIPILRFQSTYELCPEYVDRLEDLFIEK